MSYRAGNYHNVMIITFNAELVVTIYSNQIQTMSCSYGTRPDLLHHHKNTSNNQ